MVIWTKPERPDWMDEATYDQMPDQLEVRELRFKVEQPGFRVNEIVLVTTMLDGELYTKEELADLYLKRWHIELDLRSIKDVLQMEVLRCQSPEMVEKEIWMHLLAYNLIRGGIAEAARRTEATASAEFQGGVANDDGVPRVVAQGDSGTAGSALGLMLKAIAGHRVGNGPAVSSPGPISEGPNPRNT